MTFRLKLYFKMDRNKDRKKKKREKNDKSKL